MLKITISSLMVLPLLFSGCDNTENVRKIKMNNDNSSKLSPVIESIDDRFDKINENIEGKYIIKSYNTINDSIKNIINTPTKKKIIITKSDLLSNGYLIKDIENPSEEFQEISVKQNGYFIRFIKNPSLNIQKMAIKNWGGSIQFISTPSEELQKMAIHDNSNNIKYIKKPSLNIQKIVIKDNYKNISKIAQLDDLNIF